MARTKAVLGDARREERAEWMLERIVATGSLVLREVGGTRSEEMAAHRLLSSDDVGLAALLTSHVARTAVTCKGRRVVAAQDTTEINFDRYHRAAAGLGPTENEGIRGFFVHPVVAVDAGYEALLGVAGARIWTRGEQPTRNHSSIPLDEKESRCGRPDVRGKLALRGRVDDQHAVLLRNRHKTFGLNDRARAGLCQLQRVAAGIEHHEVCGVPRFGFQLPGDLGETQRLIPKLAGLCRLHVNGDEVVGAPIRRAMAGIVEEPNRVWSRGLQAPRVGVDGTR
jgi:hypothetical protein